MRIFVAGATGVIGRRLVPMLVERGHEVTAMTRSPEKSDMIRAMGATPAIRDVFDAEGLRAELASATPEVVIHQLTDLPPDVDPRKATEQLEGNDRIREEGTRNLVDAAVDAGHFADHGAALGEGELDRLALAEEEVADVVEAVRADRGRRTR